MGCGGRFVREECVVVSFSLAKENLVMRFLLVWLMFCRVFMHVCMRVLMFVFSPVQGGILLLILASIAIGALFGAVMGYLGYSVAKGRRDFTSASQVVARRYDVLCQPRTAEQARDLLSRMELGQRG